jgi:hypothetical protein
MYTPKKTEIDNGVFELSEFFWSKMRNFDFIFFFCHIISVIEHIFTLFFFYHINSVITQIFFKEYDDGVS